jgi:gentisate 1,2-dioxygenase
LESSALRTLKEKKGIINAVDKQKTVLNDRMFIISPRYLVAVINQW